MHPLNSYEYSDRIEMDNPGNLYGKVHPDNFPNENDYRNPIIADAMKIFGYVNSFGRGINMVQEELEENKNGLAKFIFDDITTFKVIVKNADVEAVNDTENNTDKRLIHTDNQNNIKNTNKDFTENNIKNEAENEAEKLTDRQEKIVALIIANNTISRESIAKQLNISDSSTYRDIEKIKKLGIIERIGVDKGGYWKIKK